MFEEQAIFSAATFNRPASFLESSFKHDAVFVLANFVKEADFTHTTFERAANFGQATFADYLTFAGNEKRLAFGEFARLNLMLSKIERPDRVSFQNLTIRPHWFAPVNARQFDFLNVRCRFKFHDEIDSLKNKVVFPYGKLARAFRDLAINCEERHRYKESSRFRFWVFETGRREKFGGWAIWHLNWWYFFASGYGEQAWRAFLVLIGIWLIAAFLYTFVGFARWEPKISNEPEANSYKRDDAEVTLNSGRALTYSLAVMTLQRPEPKPATTSAQSLVLIETILGPVQAALLALAIRRKFMR